MPLTQWIATIAGAAFLAYRLWNRNRRAAVSAVLSAISELSVVAMTDYPGGVAPLISFPLHGRIALGHAGMVGSMPRMMGAFTDFTGTAAQEPHHLIEAAG